MRADRKISILMPCYNAEKFIEEAVKSLLNQTYKDWELIVVDDGSTDLTPEILSSLARIDKRITPIFSKVNKGIIYQRNKLLTLCKTKWACWADADDIYDSKRLEIQLEKLESNNKLGAVTCNYYKLHENKVSKVTLDENKISKEYLIFNNAVLNPGSMFNMDLVRKNNILFRENLSGASDYQFWCEISRYAELQLTSEYLVIYRVHEAQESSANRRRQLTGHCEIVKRNLFELGVDVSIDQVAKLLIFPANYLGIKIEKIDHIYSIMLIERIVLLKSKRLFNEHKFRLILLTIARAHVYRMKLKDIYYLFKIFGFFWLKESNYYGFELALKMFLKR